MCLQTISNSQQIWMVHPKIKHLHLTTCKQAKKPRTNAWHIVSSTYRKPRHQGPTSPGKVGDKKKGRIAGQVWETFFWTRTLCKPCLAQAPPLIAL
jgi:hypothetical protein